jgi:hypothetical protein
MLDFPRWKIWGITLLCLVGIMLAIPSMFPASQVARWPGWVPSARINLGLDLAGGSYLLLEGDTRDIAAAAEQMEELIEQDLRRAFPPHRDRRHLDERGTPFLPGPQPRPRPTPRARLPIARRSPSASPASATGTCRSSTPAGL